MVAGLGTITPASGFVGPAGALVIGIVAGLVCFNAVIIIYINVCVKRNYSQQANNNILFRYEKIHES
jgi:hypothetical protein